METTIKISTNVKAMLDNLKLHKRETYNDVIEFMLEDNLELNAEIKKKIGDARKRIAKGDFHTQEDVERMFGVE